VPLDHVGMWSKGTFSLENDRHGVVGIYCHLKFSVVQTQRLFNLTSKSYSKADVLYTW
jgi:hypothetical protein